MGAQETAPRSQLLDSIVLRQNCMFLNGLGVSLVSIDFWGSLEICDGVTREFCCNCFHQLLPV